MCITIKYKQQEASNMNGDEIRIANISTIDILRKEGENNIVAKATLAEAKNFAKQKGGKILRLRRFSNGYFLEVFFTTQKAKEEWETFIKLKKE